MKTVTGIRLSMDGIRHMLMGRLHTLSNDLDGDWHLNPNLRAIISKNACRDAAVLIPLIEREQERVNVILTKRTETLSNHAGQIAFPGGRIDSEDESAAAAALREANEEIGMPVRAAKVLGRMPDYETGSGFRIVPVIAEIDRTFRPKPNPDEVAECFEVPLEFLMDPSNHRLSSQDFQGARRHYYEMLYGRHRIWGVTAGIIRVLHDRVFVA